MRYSMVWCRFNDVVWQWAEGIEIKGLDVVQNIIFNLLDFHLLETLSLDVAFPPVISNSSLDLIKAARPPPPACSRCSQLIPPQETAGHLSLTDSTVSILNSKTCETCVPTLPPCPCQQCPGRYSRLCQPSIRITDSRQTEDPTWILCMKPRHSSRHCLQRHVSNLKMVILRFSINFNIHTVHVLESARIDPGYSRHLQSKIIICLNIWCTAVMWKNVVNF
jgi:hypothetical protein